MAATSNNSIVVNKAARGRQGSANTTTYQYHVYNMAAATPTKRNLISKGWRSWGSLVSRRSKTTYSKDMNNTNKDGEEEKPMPPQAAAERRRISVAQMEGIAAEFLHVKVIETDMPQFMQVHAFRCAATAAAYDDVSTDNYFSSKNMAFHIKKDFDKAYGAAWQCIVGSSFGSFVTHATSCFLYFSMGPNLYILIFKTKVQRALFDHI